MPTSTSLSPALPRRLAGELIGTAGLVAVVVGSGAAAQRLTDDVALALLANSLATVGGLAVIILVVGPVSGAHINPVITAVEWALARRRSGGLSGGQAAAYVAAQVAGGVLGAVVANLMYDEPAVVWSDQVRAGAPIWLGEVVATAGLVLVVVALARNGRAAQTAWAVGAYIGAAYWFTSSTSFANPAVTIGRAFTETFAGIAPSSVPGFLLAQLLGAAVGLGLVTVLYPREVARGRLGARGLVVPHPGPGVDAAPESEPTRSQP
jgi:arsenate reductase